MNHFSGPNKRLLVGAMVAGIGGILLLAASDSRSQGIGGVLREHTRIFVPPGAVAPNPAVVPFDGSIPSAGQHIELKAQKRLVLSAEGSNVIFPVPSGKLYYGQTGDGEIWLNVSYDDGSPFTQAKAADIHIETLTSAHDGGDARLDTATSRPSDGVWHFILPALKSGSHFYRLSVESDIQAWKANYEGQTIVRASYTRLPYWNAQRVDGTIWEPPK